MMYSRILVVMFLSLALVACRTTGNGSGTRQILLNPEVSSEQHFMDIQACKYHAEIAGASAANNASSGLGGGLIAGVAEGWASAGSRNSSFKSCTVHKNYEGVQVSHSLADAYFDAIKNYEWDTTPLGEILERPEAVMHADWLRTKRSDSVEAYSTFLAAYPDSPYTNRVAAFLQANQ